MDVELIKSVARLTPCTKEEFHQFIAKLPDEYYHSVCLHGDVLILMYFVLRDKTLINIGQANLKDTKFLILKE